MAKQEKKYIITTHNSRSDRDSDTEPMTVAQAVEYFSYTLETGASYEHERGNKKINRNPTTIKALITNLNNARSNAAANGCSNYSYSAKEVTA